MITEKEIKELCKNKGCWCPEYHEIAGEYASLPECLRLFCWLMEERSIKAEGKGEQ